MGYSAHYSEVEINQRSDRTEGGHDFSNGSRFREEAYSHSGQEIFRQQSAAQYRSDAHFLPVVEIVDGGNGRSMAGNPMSNRECDGRSEAPYQTGNDLAMLDRTMRDAGTLLREYEQVRGQGGDCGVSQEAITPAAPADQPAQTEASSGDQSSSMGSKAVQSIEKLVNQWTGADGTSTTSDTQLPGQAGQQSAAPAVIEDPSGS